MTAATWALNVSRRTLLRTRKNPREVLWYLELQVYVPPVYARWVERKRW
jgi:hypothetical protein